MSDAIKSIGWDIKKFEKGKILVRIFSKFFDWPNRAYWTELTLWHK